MARREYEARYMREDDPNFRLAWSPHERGDVDYGREPAALRNPELISGATVDILKKEKDYVETAQKSIKSLNAFLEHIKLNENKDPLVRYVPGNYPAKHGICAVL